MNLNPDNHLEYENWMLRRKLNELRDMFLVGHSYDALKSLIKLRELAIDFCLCMPSSDDFEKNGEWACNQLASIADEELIKHNVSIIGERGDVMNKYHEFFILSDHSNNFLVDRSAYVIFDKHLFDNGFAVIEYGIAAKQTLTLVRS